VPRYYFHLYDDIAIMDEEGSELPDLAAARAKAVDTAREMACAEVLEGHLNVGHRIEVASEAGEVQLTVQFADVVKVEAAPPADLSSQSRR
jgi:hypothetical protein